MSRKQKTSREGKKKVPFNVFRNGAVALAAAGVMLATPLMLTGCAGEKGEAGSTWFSGTHYSENEGRVGDFFYDTDDCNIYRKTESGWTLISSIKGDTGVAKKVEIQATQDYIQWRYEGETSWQNLVSLASLKGETGEAEEVLIQANAEYIQWKYVSDEEWQNIVSLASLKGVKGDDGKEVLLNVSATHIQWKHEGETEWENLIALETLKGLKGDDGKSAYQIALEQDPTIGSEAEWLESLKGQDGREVVFNVSNTHIQWKYEGEEEWRDLISIETLKGLKGDDGKSAYEIALEQDPTIGSEADWLASLKGEKGDKGDKGDQGAPGEKGETGKGVTNVEIVYEYDEATGQLYAVFTITYSEGEPEIIKTAVPKRVTTLEGISLGSYHVSLDRFAKVESEEEAPTLYLRVRFDDNTEGQILLTDDMFTNDEMQGYTIPNFTEVGTYNYEIKYMGKTCYGNIEVVNLSDFEGFTVSSVNLSDYQVSTEFNKNNLLVSISYVINKGEGEEYINVTAPLTAVAESFYSYKTSESLTELDLTKPDNYEITLKSQFAYDSEYDEDTENEKLYLTVYDVNCTISSISIDDIEFTVGDEDFEDTLKTKTFNGYLHKEKDGSSTFYGTIADLNYDLTNFDINKVGEQYIPYTYQLEGETGVYSNFIRVSVIADLSEATVIGTYNVNMENADMTMFAMTYGGSVTLYDNGVADIDGTQTTYDVALLESGVFKFYDSYMNDFSYYAINSETSTIDFYAVEGEIIPTDYTCEIEIMGQLFDATISIYGTEGTCKGKVSVLMPKEITEAPEDMYFAYSYVDCVWEDEDTISSIGRTFNVTTGNVLVEVTE